MDNSNLIFFEIGNYIWNDFKSEIFSNANNNFSCNINSFITLFSDSENLFSGNYDWFKLYVQSAQVSFSDNCSNVFSNINVDIDNFSFRSIASKITWKYKGLSNDQFLKINN